MPNSPVPQNLRGVALLGKKDLKAAREAFESALGIKADFLPSRLYLAKLDLMEGNIASAKLRYRQVLSYDAGNLDTLLVLATLAENEGNKGEAEKWLKQARSHHPEASKPALMLVEHYLRQDDTEQALDIAREIAVVKPRDPFVLRALAIAQFKAGDDKAALNTLQTLIDVVPRSPEAHVLLATGTDETAAK